MIIYVVFEAGRGLHIKSFKIMEGKKDSRPSAGARASKKFQAKKGPEQGGEETKRQRKRRIGQQQSPPYRPGTRH